MAADGELVAPEPPSLPANARAPAQAVSRIRSYESRVTATRSAGQGPFALSDFREGSRRWGVGEAGAARQGG